MKTDYCWNLKGDCSSIEDSRKSACSAATQRELRTEKDASSGGYHVPVQELRPGVSLCGGRRCDLRDFSLDIPFSLAKESFDIERFLRHARWA
ncbi:hypothetical protein HNY73_017487 [Argiope bruennichi]|uniref:Uncharacterized protein n=1 Tax=Argiope bruennichi TaxID=94029 RepID=A0A8T0E9U3_ARGBR|nr:hypothetical protein HNY73_017487 [Argiope bruennichi]